MKGKFFQIHKSFEIFKSNPRNIFLLDGIGALVSALSLLLIIAPFEVFFGMPGEVVHKLAILAFVFCTYSVVCYILNPIQWRFFLKIIIISNTMYCLISLCLLVYFYNSITLFGYSYFIMEKLVILFLVYFEIQMGRMEG
ncbi:hypothetical protein P3G55_12815 [Leptospira sp. 96542]|nr:hypothetical protein [Leptospira sp. 96542]